MRVLIILIGLLGLTACSQKSAKVKLELTSSFVFGGSTAMQDKSEGGLMVWGLSSNGDSFSRVLNSSDAIDLELPNGTWTFSAVAWDDMDTVVSVMDSDLMRCARSAPMVLDGSEAKVALVLTEPGCENPNFRGGSNTAAAESPMVLMVCKDTSGISFGDACTNDPQETSRKSDKAAVMSVRVRLAEFDKFGGNTSNVGAGLSQCVSMPTTLLGEGNVTGVFAVPVGNPADPASSPFRMELELFWNDVNCTAANDLDSRVMALPNGLVSSNLGHKYFDDGSYQYLYVNVPDSFVCNGRGALAPFAGGDGSIAFPHVICSAQQLYEIHKNSAYLTQSFRLAADLDLNPFTKGVVGSTPSEWPTSATFWSEGQNWQPIGFSGTTYAPVTFGFRASFFGGDHTIKGLRARMNTDSVGFIGEWNLSSAGHMVTGLVLEEPEIKGTSYVGGVVGTMNGTAMGLLANLEVRGGEVSAEESAAISMVGGVLGQGTNSNLLNLKTSRVKIEGEGQFIGGIFGHISETEILSKLVSRSYVGGPEWASSRFVGGIGGSLSSTSLMVGAFGEWASESIVVGNQSVGGLLGEWSSTVNGPNSVLTDVYAAGSVSIRGENGNHLGGLFGNNAATASLLNAYFAGSLVNNSSTLNCGSTCNIGWFSGSALSMVRTQTYVMYETDGTHHSIPLRAGLGDNPGSPWSIPPVSPSGIFTSGSMTGLNSGAWIHATGDKPRLIFEKHPCSMNADADGISPRSSLATQKAKWGTATKPIMICRKDQFAELTTELGSGKIGVIVGALNLGSIALDVPPNLVAGAYLTGEGGYIHGLRRVETSGTFNIAPFNTISGVLKNLLIAGIDLSGIATSSSSISGLAVTNSGLVEDVKFLTGVLSQNDPDVKLTGLVNVNSPTGTLRNVRFEGSLVGDGEIAGLVRNNSGTIEDAEAAGDLRLYNGGINIGGVAITNTGSGVIRRVSMSSKLKSNSYSTAANDVGMVAVTNIGTIQDVHITTEANWLGNFGANVSQVVVTQSGGTSVLKRIVAEGFLHDVQNSNSATDGDLNFNKFPAGTMRSIYAVPAGRLIAEASPAQIATCSGSTLTMQGGFTVPSAFASYWQAGMLAANKVVWVLFDDGDGKVNYARVTGASYSPLVATLSQTCAFLEFTGTTRIRFLQDFNSTLVGATGDLTLSPYVGFNLNNPQRYSVSSLLGEDWDDGIAGAPVPDTVIARDTPGMDWILDIMGEFITTGTSTTPKPIWEVDGDEKIELFKIKK